LVEDLSALISFFDAAIARPRISQAAISNALMWSAYDDDAMRLLARHLTETSGGAVPRSLAALAEHCGLSLGVFARR
jgi:hypothetical protein